MADAKVTKIGINSAVAAEEAAAPAVEASNEPVAPNVSERRVVGTQEFPAPDGSVIKVTHL